MSVTARVAHLSLTDFRCFEDLDLGLEPGLTVLTGANGQGKTSILEAIVWGARGESFRGVPDAALVRRGRDRAILRCEVDTGGRGQTLEAELRRTGRNRVLLNRNPVARRRDLHGLLRVTVFAPDDLQLVKGGPAERRAFLDEILAMLAPRYDAARTDYERVLRQRNALLRGGVRDREAEHTLGVWDTQLVAAGAEIVRGRLRLVERLASAVDDAYRAFAGAGAAVHAAYEAEWAEGALDAQGADAVPGLLERALHARRRAELDRGVSLVGPHRDEWRLTIGGLDSRSQASQGEQRSLALALRLGGHDVCTELTGTAPVLLLDDVFSELDERRSRALVERLPAGQALLTTAGTVPAAVHPDRSLRVVDGRVEPV